MIRQQAVAFDYSLFGLKIRSDLALPELLPVQSDTVVDVTISLGELPGGRGEAGLQPDGDALLLTIPDVARYRIASGVRILVDPYPGAPERNVRLFLLGSAFGALLHQRGLLPLHANAVEIDGRAVAFLGESGAGKSTLAIWFHDHGYPILADDVCVVNFDASGQALGHPGLPRLRLWRDALERSGRAASDHDRSYGHEFGYDKYDVSFGTDTRRDPLPLAAIYLLARGSPTSIEPMIGIDAVEAIMANVYRGVFAGLAGTVAENWKQCVGLARHCPVFRFERAWESGFSDAEAEAVVRHFRAVVDQITDE